MMSNDWVLKSIEPKSDQLNADDLLTGPIDVTVQDVKRGNAEQPIVIEIGEGKQPYKPGKSMRRVLIKVWGDTPKTWIGKQMRLFCDPNVQWGGARVGGIRISHMSHIESPLEIMLTVTRGKRAAHRVEPLKANDAGQKLAKTLKWLDSVDSIEKLESFDSKLDELFDAVDDNGKKQLRDSRKNAYERLTSVGR